MRPLLSLATLCAVLPWTTPARAQEITPAELLASTDRDPIACALLALVATDEGSTMRSGLWRGSLKSAVMVSADICSRAPDAEALDLRTLALTTFALAEVQLHARYASFSPLVRTCATRLDEQLRATPNPHGADLAWTALALRSARDSGVVDFDLGRIVNSTRECTARLDDPHEADLARLALEIAMPEFASKDVDPLTIGKRLEPGDDEELALATLILEIRAHKPGFDACFSRLRSRRERITVTDRPPTELLALRFLTDRAAQRQSRILRLDETLVIRVLDAEGKPAKGYLDLPIEFGSCRRLQEGQVELRPSPLPGLPIRFASTTLKTDVLPLPETVPLGSLPDSLGTNGFEVVFRLPR